MVAINSIPQQEVANGKGHNELALANPTTSFNLVAKKPSPTTPSGGATIFVLESVIIDIVFNFYYLFPLKGFLFDNIEKTN